MGSNQDYNFFIFRLSLVTFVIIIHNILEIDNALFRKEDEFDLVHEVLMTMDEVVMATNKDLDESCDELIQKFNSNYNEIISYLFNKYNVQIL